MSVLKTALTRLKFKYHYFMASLQYGRRYKLHIVDNRIELEKKR